MAILGFPLIYPAVWNEPWTAVASVAAATARAKRVGIVTRRGESFYSETNLRRALRGIYMCLPICQAA